MIRKDWESIKVDQMRQIVSEKFRQNPELKEKLINAGKAYLEEGNIWRIEFRWKRCKFSGTDINDITRKTEN